MSKTTKKKSRGRHSAHVTREEEDETVLNMYPTVDSKGTLTQLLDEVQGSATVASSSFPTDFSLSDTKPTKDGTIEFEPRGEPIAAANRASYKMIKARKQRGSDTSSSPEGTALIAGSMGYDHVPSQPGSIVPGSGGRLPRPPKARSPRTGRRTGKSLGSTSRPSSPGGTEEVLLPHSAMATQDLSETARFDRLSKRAAKNRQDPGLTFDYSLAFSRNLGLLSVLEQRRIGAAHVCVAGMGGVGSAHCMALARAGIQHFRIADFDIYEVGNFNRQLGATMSSVGESKAAVMREVILDINPEAEVEVFGDGITPDNVDAFVRGCDVVVDGIDFFAPKARRLLFTAARAAGIPAVTAAPLSEGTSVMVFSPTGKSFDDVTGIRYGMDDLEMCARFYVSLCPKPLHLQAIVEPWRLDLGMRQGPSHVAGIMFAAGGCVTETIKLIMRRGPIMYAPAVVQFDMFSHRSNFYSGRWTLSAWRSLKSRIVVGKIRKGMALSKALTPPDHESLTDLEWILDAARWAPSADNAQRWRFTIVDKRRVLIRLLTSEDVNLRVDDGALATAEVGMLLEVMRLAALECGRDLHYRFDQRDSFTAEASVLVELPRLGTKLTESNMLHIPPSSQDAALYTYIRRRHTRRGAYSSTPVPEAVTDEMIAIASEVGVDIGLYTSRGERFSMARMNMEGTRLRLKSEGGTTSLGSALRFERWPEVGLPASGFHMSAMNRPTMPIIVNHPKMMRTMCRYVPRATIIPGIDADLMPGISCHAHVTFSLKPGDSRNPKTCVLAGAGILRAWLVMAMHNVVFQPHFAPIAYSWAAHCNDPILKGSFVESATHGFLKKCNRVWARVGTDASRIMFQGRMGMAPHAPLEPRSVRLPLEKLMRK